MKLKRYDYIKLATSLLVMACLPLYAKSSECPYRSQKRETFSVATDLLALPYAVTSARDSVRLWGMPVPENQWKEWDYLKDTYPILCDWLLQDLPWEGDDQEKAIRFLREGPSPQQWQEMIHRVCVETGKTSAGLSGQSWLEKYVEACRLRRQKRLQPLITKAPQVVFTKHYSFGTSFNAIWTFYGFTEALSESTAAHYDWKPGSSLCVLEVDAEGSVYVKTLLEDPHGVIRDPDVSYDGKRILFAWKKSLRADDYHLYEMNVSSGQLRQLTHERGQADYEPIYLPDGDILFNSTRCVQSVDCVSLPVSNLFRCNADGKNIRRLTYDQVHNNFPRLLYDGRILYTRWEYNDRGQKWPQPLFAMRPDGTGQMALYGGNSFFPTSLLHARPIPGSLDIVAIASGHHTAQFGKLARINFDERQDNPQSLGTFSGDYNIYGIPTGQIAEGIKYLAPEKEAEVVLRDFFGQEGELFSHPYPLDDKTFLVSYTRGAFIDKKDPTRPWREPLDLYLITADGRRELLARDRNTSCNQPVPLRPRPKPPVLASTIRPQLTTGTYYLQDIYKGPGLKGIERGAVKKLRVVELEYRAAGIGSGTNMGIAGASAVFTPISVPIAGGSWDVKRVLGEVEVAADGSAVFQVPAETPVFFQAIDSKGYVMQTMRSWSTLHRGEMQSCIGCHESNKEVPAHTANGYGSEPFAVQTLNPFYGIRDGFSFLKQIQPILNKHCVQCHWDTSRIPEELRAGEPPMPDAAKGSGKAFSLREIYRDTKDGTKRLWSDGYLALVGGRLSPVFDAHGVPSAGEPHWGPDLELMLQSNRAGTKLVNWISAQSEPTMLEPYTAGAATSKLMEMLRNQHKEVQLTQEELDKIACWIDLCVPYCGDYMEANNWTDEEIDTYQYYQRRREELSTPERDHVVEILQ